MTSHPPGVRACERDMICWGPPDKEALSDRPLGWDTGHGRCITNCLTFIFFVRAALVSLRSCHTLIIIVPTTRRSTALRLRFSAEGPSRLRKSYLIYPFETPLRVYFAIVSLSPFSIDLSNLRNYRKQAWAISFFFFFKQFSWRKILR